MNVLPRPDRLQRAGLLAAIAAAVVLIAMAIAAMPAQAAYEIEEFSTQFLDAQGNQVTQAGSHPDIQTSIFFTEAQNPQTGLRTEQQMREIVVDLPAGFYGDPTATPQCPREKFISATANPPCPAVSQVGTLLAVLSGMTPKSMEEAFGPNGFKFFNFPVYNIEPTEGETAVLAANVIGVPVSIQVTPRTDGDFGLQATIKNIDPHLNLHGSVLTLWGVPADSSHDELRPLGQDPNTFEYIYGPAGGAIHRPFISMPARCDAPLTTTLRTRSWQQPERWLTASEDLPTPTGCDLLRFSPSVRVKPTTSQAGAPSGYDVDVHVPQDQNVESISTPQLRDAVVTMPEGVAVSPSSANGLEGCTDEEAKLGTREEPSCPNGSKIGTVSIDTPLLSNPLTGEIILRSPKPGELFRLLLVARGSGIVLKVPGTAIPNPQTGQLTATFHQTPQLPFEDLHLHFNGGNRAPLVNPKTCGTKVVTTTMTPWAGPMTTPSASFEITGCKDSFSPGLEAGAENPVAGASSPFLLQVTRHDGDQDMSVIDVTLPPGQLAQLRGVPYCPDAALVGISGEEGAGAVELARPSCPAASQVGKVVVAAGAGATPLYVDTGKAYLAGPYKGAPLSIAFVTPAIAGPFDLGNVVVRAALKINPVTAQVEAVSDPLPTILHGVPLDLRDVRVSLDRPDFTVNPTSCQEMRVTGTVTSVAGTTAKVGNRYQLSDCAALGFKPKLSLKLSGPTRRGAHPALRAVLKARKGDANVGKAVVTLPKTEFLENAHIRTVCTRVQYAADSCPKGSIYGYAKAWSPLLDKPLQGPVYLRSSNHPLPDLVASLDGQIHIDLAGRIDSVNERMRASFASVPDAPVSRFVLNMQGGSKGLLVNNTELCEAKPHASAQFTGHNGKRSSSNPLVKTGCGKAKQK